MNRREQTGNAIVIPVKSLNRAKLRLSEMLKPEERRRLGLAMLADVLRATEKFDSRFLVTADPDAEAVGIAFGCELVADPGSGLNPALDAGTRAAARAGAARVLILPSDVPMVSADDITSLFSYSGNVVIAPSQDGGTNALMRYPPEAIALHFGPNSAEAHRTAADRAGLSSRSVKLGSLLLDIDQYADLVALGSMENERDSVRVARELVGRYPL